MVCGAASVWVPTIHLKNQIVQTVDLTLADMQSIQQSGPVRPQEPQLLRTAALMLQLQKPCDVRLCTAGIFQIASQELICLRISVHSVPSFFSLALLFCFHHNALRHK